MPIVIALATGSVYISDINFDAPGNDNQNPNGEWVRITNDGSSGVNMNGWTLSDEGENYEYPFHSFILSPGADVTLFSGSGQDSATELYMGFDRAIWNNDGDVATLKDDQGTIIDQKRG